MNSNETLNQKFTFCPTGLDEEELDFIAHIPYSVSTWQESRGEHFGTPCSESMSEVEVDIDNIEWECVDKDIGFTREQENEIMEYILENAEDWANEV